jgi:hypothetical protein
MRDMDLVRELLLKLEEFSTGSGQVYHIWMVDGDDAFVEGYPHAQINEHLSLIRDAGFLMHGRSAPTWGILFRGLSWKGHEYLENIRDPEIWRKTKEGAQKIGAFSLDLVGALAKGLIKKQIEKHTGVDIDL